MPTVNVLRNLLFTGLGRTYTDDEFADVCFAFGIELDEVTTEQQMILKEQGVVKGDASNEVIYRIDIPANRHDLLCLEGLTRGLLIFFRQAKLPTFNLVKAKEKLTVKASTASVRPYVVAGILRGVSFDDHSYRSFIEFQEKLNFNVGRKRTLISIGTHDIDSVEGPFVYDARPPEKIKFVPLNHDKEYTTSEMMQLFSKESHLKPYLSILDGKNVYPVIEDSKSTVLSWPPITNSEHSKITPQTKNILVEITATDLSKAHLALDYLLCTFSEYCRDKYSIESVQVVYEKTREIVYSPKMSSRNEKVSCDSVNNSLGLNLKADDIVSLLEKMSLSSTVSSADNKILDITIPPVRQDILHTCDLVEDVAIAYGYNNIKPTLPKVVTIACQLPINKISDQLRNEFARCGFTEALTFALCSREDESKLLHKSSLMQAIEIANPKTSDFQIARTTLLAGLLKTVQSNLKMPLPFKLFEVSDVVLLDDKIDVGARNERRIAALYAGKSPGFEVIHGLLDRFISVLGIPLDRTHYKLEPANSEYFFSCQLFNLKLCSPILLSCFR